MGVQRIQPVCRGCGTRELTLRGDCPPFPEGQLSVLPDGIDFSRARGRFYRCKVCSLAVREPCLGEEELRLIYSNMHAGQMVYPFESNAAWLAARDYLAAKWSDHDRPRILDVGCNEGLFLAGLPERWLKYGLEASADAGGQARAHGVEIIGDFLGDGGRETRGCFDVVCLFDVFEHLLLPEEGLRSAVDYLKPGGILIVSTGDLDSWPIRWLGADHWYLQTPLHINVGSRPFFRYLAPRLGCCRLSFGKVSHRVGTNSEVNDNVLETLYYGCMKKGGLWRIPQVAIHSLARYAHYRHRQAAPFAVHLRDHLVVFTQKQGLPVQ